MIYERGTYGNAVNSFGGSIYQIQTMIRQNDALKLTSCFPIQRISLVDTKEIYTFLRFKVRCATFAP